MIQSFLPNDIDGHFSPLSKSGKTPHYNERRENEKG